MKKSKDLKPVKTIGYVILTAMALIDLIPLAWMLLCSFKSRSEILSLNFKILPEKWMWQNYADAWNAGGLDFGKMFLNTFLIVGPGTFFTVLTATLAAFAFARIDFKGRELIFSLFLLSLMIPDSMVLIPRFILFSSLGLMDSLWPVLIPQLFGYALPIFLARQFFMTIPQDLEDAATIDGCNRFRIWRSVFMPISKPIVATLTIFVFQSYYNDFLFPLVYINSSDKFTVQLGLASFRGLYSSRNDLMMAASMFILVPILVIYICAQKYFVEGIVTSGIKG